MQIWCLNRDLVRFKDNRNRVTISAGGERQSRFSSPLRTAPPSREALSKRYCALQKRGKLQKLLARVLLPLRAALIRFYLLINYRQLLRSESSKNFNRQTTVVVHFYKSWVLWFAREMLTYYVITNLKLLLYIRTLSSKCITSNQFIFYINEKNLHPKNCISKIIKLYFTDVFSKTYCH